MVPALTRTGLGALGILCLTASCASRPVPGVGAMAPAAAAAPDPDHEKRIRDLGYRHGQTYQAAEPSARPGLVQTNSSEYQDALESIPSDQWSYLGEAYGAAFQEGFQGTRRPGHGTANDPDFVEAQALVQVMLELNEARKRPGLSAQQRLAIQERMRSTGEQLAMKLQRLTPEQSSSVQQALISVMQEEQAAKEQAEAREASEVREVRSSERAPGGVQQASDQQRSWVVAVMDLQTTGSAQLNAEMLRGFTDQLRVFLGARDLKVVDRSEQEQAMREAVQNEKQNSYSACVDEACQIPLGKALAASHILRSSLGRFGSKCTLNGELIDLRREVTVAAAYEHSGCDDGALLEAAERLTGKLIEKSASSR